MYISNKTLTWSPQIISTKENQVKFELSFSRIVFYSLGHALYMRSAYVDWISVTLILYRSIYKFWIITHGSKATKLSSGSTGYLLQLTTKACMYCNFMHPKPFLKMPSNCCMPSLLTNKSNVAKLVQYQIILVKSSNQFGSRILIKLNWNV